MKINKKTFVVYFLIGSIATIFSAMNISCVNESPMSILSSSNIFADGKPSYKGYLAKLYAGLALMGQTTVDGDKDVVSGKNPSYLSQLFYMQESSTEEVLMAWDFPIDQSFHNHNWTSDNIFLTDLYSRLFTNVALCNQYMKETDPSKTQSLDRDLQRDIALFRAESRFLRALMYWNLLDMYRNVPLVDEATSKTQATPLEMFSFIEKELLDIESTMPLVNEYGRANKYAVWMLLSKLYLNAEVYIQTKKYTECATYCKKIIDGGQYGLVSNYSYLFLADNNVNGAQNEIIFPICFDGNNTRTWSGINFIFYAALSANDMDTKNQYGAYKAAGWEGARATKDFIGYFPDATGTIDKRSSLFYTKNRSLDIFAVGVFSQGYSVVKYRNIKSDGSKGSTVETTESIDTDFPLFRYADALLMYAEAVYRGGTGDKGLALSYVNQVQSRSGVAARTQSDDATMLQFILDERSRELYWECHRRTDLIRYGQFTANKVWAWKGGVQSGKVTDTKYNIYPIPSNQLIANPSLKQNAGF